VTNCEEFAMKPSDICFKMGRKTTKTLNQDGLILGRDSKPGISERCQKF